MENSQFYREMWNDFKNSIRYNNRFFCESEILSHIKKMLEGNEEVLESGSVLYRARKYNKKLEFLEKFNLGVNLATTKMLASYEIKNGKLVANPDNQDSVWDEMIDRLINNAELKNKKESGFWGYGEEESFIPNNKNIVKNGRANPNCITYLYASEEKIVAATEVRPIIGNLVSIAKIKVNSSLKIADLSKSLFNKILVEYVPLADLIVNEFSKPNDGEEVEYLVTQVITEYIKKIGYDGIKFRSSLYKKGINYVIFNYCDCEVLNSELHEVEDVCIELKQLGPMGDSKKIYHQKLDDYEKNNKNGLFNIKLLMNKDL